ncbi:hypothetical protein [Glutamicibacter sp.]|uniref:hypothetical protein n=1 Tax=Glutamicibacter sp. TaxID=1931995 RepID=UPI0028BF525B|nr:hypothetical protein [Glutamicibacter sp.]
MVAVYIFGRTGVPKNHLLMGNYMDLSDALLKGRRGRGLLLDVLISGDDEATRKLSRAVRDASYRLAKRRGDGVARFPRSEEDDVLVNTAELMQEHLAKLVAKVPVPTITAELLREALGRTVDEAVYWEPPHAEDVIFSDPALVEALAPVAQLVNESGILQNWVARSKNDNQWSLHWRGEDSDSVWEPGLSPVSQQLEAWKSELLATEHRNRRDLKKSAMNAGSGVWWSNPPGGLFRTFGTFDDGAPIGLYCQEDGYGWREASIQRIKPVISKPIFHVEGSEHWIELCRKYPADVSAGRRGSWYQLSGRDGLWVQPDWRAVARDFDGVHLGLPAYLSAAGEELRVSDNYSSIIAGWNPDETYWFTDRVNFTGNEQFWVVEDQRNNEGWSLQKAEGQN